MKQQHTVSEDLAEIVTFVEFSLKADTLSPAQVTQSLGIIPSRVYAKGEQYASKAFDTETKRPVPRIGTHPWGLWAVETKDMVLSTNVEDHAICLLNILEPKVEQIQAYLERSNEYSVRFYVEWISSRRRRGIRSFRHHACAHKSPLSLRSICFSSYGKSKSLEQTAHRAVSGG